MLPHFSNGPGKPFGDFSWLAVYRGRSVPVARQARHDKSPNISSPCRAPRKVPSWFPKFLKLVVKSSFRLGGNRKRSAGILPEYKIPPHLNRISLSLLRDLRELERSGCEKFFCARPVNGKIKNLNRRPQRPRRNPASLNCHSREDFTTHLRNKRNSGRQTKTFNVAVFVCGEYTA